MQSNDLALLQDLSNLLYNLQEIEISVDELLAFKEELIASGLLPNDSATPILVEAFLSQGKYDHGFGIAKEQWADDSDPFDVEFLVYDEEGKKLSDKDPKNSGNMKLKDAVKKADELKKKFDAYKVLVTEKKTGSMLARLTTKGPSKVNVNLKPFNKEA